MSQQQIEMVELSLEMATKAVATRDAILRLSKNRDFKKIIMDGFLYDDAARLAHLSSDAIISDEVRASVMRDLNGCGALKRYLFTQTTKGNQAEDAISVDRDTLDELRNEQEG